MVRSLRPSVRLSVYVCLRRFRFSLSLATYGYLLTLLCARSWVPLLNIHCHENTRMFLCSLFAPICLDRPIYPCRTLCEAVQTGCESRMLNYGFPWPDMLRCDKFPLDNDLCVGLQHHSDQQGT